MRLDKLGIIVKKLDGQLDEKKEEMLDQIKVKNTYFHPEIFIP